MRRAAAGIDWPRCAVQALLFAAMQVVTFNTGYLTYISELPLKQVPLNLTVMVGTWFVFALLPAASAQWVEGRWPWPATASLCLALCALTILQRDVNLQAQLLIGVPPDVTRAPYATFAWTTFIGGIPFFAYCLFVQRSVRVRGLLARAEIERARTSAAIGEAEADALEARVDPALLEQALVALQQAYSSERGRAEALLDALVDFLRQAMPAIRSGRSKLMDELTLLRLYAMLVQHIDGGRRLCELSLQPPSLDPGFPPRLLIPLAEALARANTAARPPRVRLGIGPNALRLDFEAEVAPHWLPVSLAQRLDRALRTNPDTAGARIETGGSRALTLWLPLPPNLEKQRHDDGQLQPV